MGNILIKKTGDNEFALEIQRENISGFYIEEITELSGEELEDLAIDINNTI